MIPDLETVLRGQETLGTRLHSHYAFQLLLENGILLLCPNSPGPVAQIEITRYGRGISIAARTVKMLQVGNYVRPMRKTSKQFSCPGSEKIQFFRCHKTQRRRTGISGEFVDMAHVRLAKSRKARLNASRCVKKVSQCRRINGREARRDNFGCRREDIVRLPTQYIGYLDTCHQACLEDDEVKLSVGNCCGELFQLHFCMGHTPRGIFSDTVVPPQRAGALGGRGCPYWLPSP